jgi:epoxyqueuosine reductase
MNAISLSRLQSLAASAGFDDAGVAQVSLLEHEATLREWLGRGYAGGMGWLTRNTEVRLDPSERFEWARSIVVVRCDYSMHRDDTGLGRYVASYAQGIDYHDLLLPRLKELAASLETAAGCAMQWHAYVDTGPILERQLAQAAGMGWIGHNTLLLSPGSGSHFFLGVLITDLELDPSRRESASCGSCTACQTACPTEAFVEAGVLDARRCISYLTIEHKGPIDRDLRPAMGEWMFGCDLCQSSCPVNYRSREVGDPELNAEDAVTGIGLADLLTLSDAEFRTRFKGTPLSRPKREGLLRNALIVAANGEHFDCVDAARSLLQDASPVLREAAAWCLATLAPRQASPWIETMLETESEDWVREAVQEDVRRLKA